MVATLVIAGALVSSACGSDFDRQTSPSEPERASSSATGPAVASQVLPVSDADREIFVFASGPDCYSVQVTTGQLYNLEFPAGWIVEERDPAGCAGPAYGSSVVAVRGADGQVLATSGDVVRVTGERVESPPTDYVPVFGVTSLEAAGLTVPAVMPLLFRDPDSPFIEVRDRLPLASCGLFAFQRFVLGPELDSDDTTDQSADVRRCVWEAYETGVATAQPSWRSDEL